MAEQREECALWRASFSINNLFRRIINRPLEETPHIIGAQQESWPASLPQVGTVSVVVMECMTAETDCRSEFKGVLWPF